MKPPLDTDLHQPRVLDRETAAARLLELLATEVADQVWDDIVGPLYDARQMSVGWSRGRCKHCSAVHPESPLAKRYPGPRKVAVRHQMRCQKYVGPLEHRVVSGHQALLGWHNDCSCGRSYPDDAWANPPVRCPDAALDWRGPRPGSETT